MSDVSEPRKTLSLSKLVTGDGAQTNAVYQRWKYVIPLPTEGLIWSTGGSSMEKFLVVGDAWAQLISHFTPKDATLLDIGCGCGRMARVLVNNRWIRRYVGFDVIRENVEWCNNFVKPSWPGSEFHWFNLYSAEYNPAGVLKASDLKFPAADKSVDVVFAASVFTHLLEPDAVRYLAEIGRVLSKRGRAILSIHNEPAAGMRFSGGEPRIDIEPDYFAEMGKKAGLLEVERIADLGGQQVFVFGRKRVGWI